MLFQFLQFYHVYRVVTGYVVIFMQLILSVDNFQGQVVSIFIVDQCVDLKILSVRNILLH